MFSCNFSSLLSHSGGWEFLNYLIGYLCLKQQKYAIATAFHMESAKVNGIMKCSRNSSWRMWAAVKFTPGPKLMTELWVCLFLRFSRLEGFHQRCGEHDGLGLDAECPDCCYGC